MTPTAPLSAPLGALAASPVCPADAPLWTLLDDLERACLNAARQIQGPPYYGVTVGVGSIARALSLGEGRIKNIIDSLWERQLWPIPRPLRGGYHESACKPESTIFEMAAWVQMARRQRSEVERKKSGQDAWLDARWEAGQRAARERAAVVWERREARVAVAQGRG